MIALGIGIWRRNRGSASAPVPGIADVTLAPLPARVGQEIACQVAWSGSPRSGVTYQWRLGGAPIAGGIAATYTPVPGDLGGALSCRVEIDDGVGTDSAESAPSTVEGPPAAGNALLIASGGGRLLIAAGGAAILVQVA